MDDILRYIEVYYITCFVKLDVLFIFSCENFEDYVLSCNMLILDTGVYIFIDHPIKSLIII